jgi:CheY-like chemotaxis protein
MPNISGAEAIQQLRANPRHATTPIILITGSPIVQPMLRPCLLGNMTLLTKPLDLNQLLTTIQQAVTTP